MNQCLFTQFLEIFFELKINFLKLLCDNGNARFDDFILEFFIKLNSITPLRVRK